MCRPHKWAGSSVLWIRESTALRSCFFPSSNGTRPFKSNFHSALTGAFAGGSLPHPGTSLRLQMFYTPLDFLIHLFFERLILYQITKSTACFIGGLVTGAERRHLRSVFAKKQIGGTKVAELSQKRLCDKQIQPQYCLSFP